MDHLPDLRIGAIGLGRRSTLLQYLDDPKTGGSRVVACADSNEVALSAAPNRFGEDVQLFHDYRNLLDRDLDAVFVMTPDHTHHEIVSACLEAGVPVFAEKPLAITPEACDNVLATAQRTRTKLYVGHNMRHLPVVAAMRELVLGGAIGNVKTIWCRHFVGRGGLLYFKDWNSEQANTTGLLLQKGVHDIDVIHWLAGAKTRRVTAFGGLVVYGIEHGNADNTSMVSGDDAPWPPSALWPVNPAADVEDLSMMLMELENGVLASYQQCHFTPDYWRNFTVIGDAGRMENFGDEDGALIKVWNSRSSRYRTEADVTLELPHTDEPHGGADRRIVEEFLRFVVVGESVSASPVAARDAVAAGYAATMSLRDGGCPIDVEPISPSLSAYFE